MQPARLRTKRAIAVAAAGAGLILIALLFDAAPLFVPASGLLVLGLATPGWVLLAARGSRVARRLDVERVVEHEPLTATIEVRRGPFGLPGAEVFDPFTGARLDLSGPLSLLRGGPEVGVRVVTHFPRRGLQVLAPPRLLTHDPLDLSRLERPGGGGPQRLLVLPATQPVRWLTSARSRRLEVTDGHAASEAMAAVDLDGLRPYRPGTPASRIHWPALARGAGLIERRLHADGDSRPLVVLDARLGPGGSVELLDAAVRAAASLTLALAQSGGCGLLLPGDQRPVTISPELATWPEAHARLAVVSSEGARAPALGWATQRTGAMVYVAARAPERLLSAAGEGGRAALVLVVPAGVLADGRVPGIRTTGAATLEVSGCRGFVLGRRGDPERVRAPGRSAA